MRGFGMKKSLPKHAPKRKLSRLSPIEPTPTLRKWSLRTADTKFREYMLTKVTLNCIFPNCPITDPNKLTVSHYHGRVNKATRFDLRNCDLLCRNHHYWDKQLGYEFQKQTIEKHGWDGRYTLYMKTKLGTDYEPLKELAATKLSPQKAIAAFQASLNTTIAELEKGDTGGEGK